MTHALCRHLVAHAPGKATEWRRQARVCLVLKAFCVSKVPAEPFRPPPQAVEAALAAREPLACLGEVFSCCAAQLGQLTGVVRTAAMSALERKVRIVFDTTSFILHTHTAVKGKV